MPEIKVRIEKGKKQSGVGNSSAVSASGSESNLSKVASISFFAHQMVGVGKQVASYAANNVGNFTGNMVLQDQINTGMELLGDMATVITGLAAGGIAGGIAAVGGIALQKAMQGATDWRNNVISQKQTDYLIARSGNETKNGSRGTEN